MEDRSLRLVESDALLDRFNQLLKTSTHVDIAVAWAGPGLAVELLLENARDTEVRVVVGLSGNSSEPATLRRLLAEESVALRVAQEPPGGVFHPKFYRFRRANQTVCWVGSANFTRGGFGGNAELVHEFGDRKEIGGEWFEDLWESLDEDPNPAVSDYEERYRTPRPGSWRDGKGLRRRDLPRLEDVETWEEFVAALHILDEYCHRRHFGWDVLSESYSYLHTIAVGSEVARRRSWASWSRRDRNILLGLQHLDDGGEWGLLGNMQGAATVVGAFTPPGNPAHRSHVHQQIQHVVQADEDGLVETAEAAVTGIRQLHRFGPAVATRFLALARPDWLVSVNGPSSDGLGMFAGMEQDEDYLATNYGQLLRTIHAKEWCGAPEPVDVEEREIWRCRAALVDAFVYIPVHEEA